MLQRRHTHSLCMPNWERSDTGFRGMHESTCTLQSARLQLLEVHNLHGAVQANGCCKAAHKRRAAASHRGCRGGVPGQMHRCWAAPGCKQGAGSSFSQTAGVRQTCMPHTYHAQDACCTRLLGVHYLNGVQEPAGSGTGCTAAEQAGAVAAAAFGMPQQTNRRPTTRLPCHCPHTELTNLAAARAPGRAGAPQTGWHVAAAAAAQKPPQLLAWLPARLSAARVCLHCPFSQPGRPPPPQAPQPPARQVLQTRPRAARAPAPAPALAAQWAPHLR